MGQTSSLRVSCDTMIQNHDKLLAVSEGIKSRLVYFDEINSITHELDGQISVLSDAFLAILNKLDSNISYLATHSHYKDSRSMIFALLSLSVPTHALHMCAQTICSCIGSSKRRPSA